MSRCIVCVGFAEWEAELWTNQQHLMSRLAARGDRILFVESLGLRRPQLSAGRDLKRIGRRLVTGLRPPRARDGLHVLSPLIVPLHGSRLARAVNARLLPAIVSRAAARLGFERPVLWSYVPQAEVLIDALDPRSVVYHCVDDIAEQKGVDHTAFRAAEERFARRADLVLASAPALVERMRTLADRVLFAPNVADTEHFASALAPGPVDAAMAALPRPRIIFVGAVTTTKLDVPLLAGIARARPGWSLALVGPIGLGDPGGDLSALRDVDNLHLLGARPHRVLPALLRGADAALIPYAVNPLTRSIFPMKVFEYLAAGLPTVTTPLPALAGVAGVSVADSVETTVVALEALMAEDSAVRRGERSAAAREHSWDRRVAEIDAALG